MKGPSNNILCLGIYSILFSDKSNITWLMSGHKSRGSPLNREGPVAGALQSACYYVYYVLANYIVHVCIIIIHVW